MKRVFGVVLASLLFVLFGGCEPSTKDYVRLEGVMLGTDMLVVADIDRAQAQYLSRAVDSLDREMKRQMSIFDANSMISQINRGESDLLTEDMCYNIELADSVSRLSGG
ncbi:MAG: FAD:protein FMN transferase, partial [Rikenellaceae bacterium]